MYNKKKKNKFKIRYMKRNKEIENNVPKIEFRKEKLWNDQK